MPYASSSTGARGLVLTKEKLQRESQTADPTPCACHQHRLRLKLLGNWKDKSNEL